MSPLPPILCHEVRRVLLRCPNWLGDTVMALPTLRALRAVTPAAEVWCVGPWAETLLDAEPGIARRLPYPPTWRQRAALARELRGAGMDLAVLLPNSFEAALFARLTGSRWRVGYAGDGRAGLLTHSLPPALGRQSQVEAYLGLLTPLGVAVTPSAPTLTVTPPRATEARRLLEGAGIPADRRAVGIQLGAAFGPSKLWPVARLAELATRLEADGRPVVFLGAPDSVALLRAVEAARGQSVQSLVGGDSPRVLPALLAQLALLIAPDSGPAHVAAAVGTPVVTLFGPTDPRLTAPWGARETALWTKPACAPCFQPRCPIDHRCLRALDVEAVLATVRRHLTSGSP